MKKAIHWALAACAGVLMPLSGYGKDPRDATLQVDDFRSDAELNAYKKMLADRLTPLSKRKYRPECVARMREIKLHDAPSMMALGGSVFNGVSSMHINWWLADWSPPAQVARALNGATTGGEVKGLHLPRYPDYGEDPYKIDGPKPTFRVGLELETTGIERLPSAVRRQGWTMDRFRSYVAADNVPFSDNLAFAGAAIDDILYGTAADYKARLKAVRRIDSIAPDRSDFWEPGPQQRTYESILEHAKYVNGELDAAKTAAALVPLFFTLNSSFVLNPTQEECQDDLTALDQVLLRKPKRLLVGVGSNSGLFTFLVTGQPIDQYCGNVAFSFGPNVREWKRYVPLQRTAHEEFLDGMRLLLNRLEAEGDGIEHIYVMGQLRPRVIANMNPNHRRGVVGVAGEYPPGQLLLGPEEYHNEYEISFAPGGTRKVTGGQLQMADELNAEVNKKLRQMVEAKNAKKPNRFVFVDLNEFEKHDVKHQYEKGKAGEPYYVTSKELPELGTETIPLDNRVLEFSLTKQVLPNGKEIGQKIKSGGMFSIDNLHPTVVGYAALATELLKSIAVHEPDLNVSQEMIDSISPQMAYARFAVKSDGQTALDGNVLHRIDSGLPTRRQWFQAGFDVSASLAGHQGFDCWPRQPGWQPGKGTVRGAQK